MPCSAGSEKVEYVEVDPTKLGWRRVGYRTWSHKDGEMFVFPPHIREVFVVPKTQIPETAKSERGFSNG